MDKKKIGEVIKGFEGLIEEYGYKNFVAALVAMERDGRELTENEYMRFLKEPYIDILSLGDLIDYLDEDEGGY